MSGMQINKSSITPIGAIVVRKKQAVKNYGIITTSDNKRCE